MPGLRTARDRGAQSVRQRGGFTIIEVVFVGSVTAILIALLLPAINYARHIARTAEGLSNLAQINRGMRAYALDHGNTLPLGYLDQDDAEDGLESDWTVKITNYVAIGRVTHKVEDDGAVTDDMLEVFTCPNATTPHLGRVHYSAHPVLVPHVGASATPKFPLYRLSKMRRPYETILVMDAAQRADDGEEGYAPPEYSSFLTTFRLGWGELASDSDYVTTHPDYDPLDPDGDNNDPIWPGPNHDDGGLADGAIRWRQHRDTAANFVFGDGHAETLRMNEVLNRNIRVDR